MELKSTRQLPQLLVCGGAPLRWRASAVARNACNRATGRAPWITPSGEGSINRAELSLGASSRHLHGNTRLVANPTPGQGCHLPARVALGHSNWSHISTYPADGSGLVEFPDLTVPNHGSRFDRIFTP